MTHSLPSGLVQNSRDPIARMKVVQLAREIIPNAWNDAEQLSDNPITVKVSAQLYDAVASIEANLAEGYSRSGGRDRARFYEYALGSVRESMVWYRASVRALGSEAVDARLDKLEEMRRLLMAIIPRERTRQIEPARQ
jgi:four helix bundle protein